MTSQPRPPGEWLPWRRKPKAWARGAPGQQLRGFGESAGVQSGWVRQGPGWEPRAGSGRTPRAPLQAPVARLPVPYSSHSQPSSNPSSLPAHAPSPHARTGRTWVWGGPALLQAEYLASFRGGCSRHAAGRVQALESRNPGRESQPRPLLAV